MGKVIKNIVRGIGSLMDIQPAPHKSRASHCLPKHSDMEAMRNDWRQVGEDLRKVMDDSKFDPPVKR